MSKLQSSSTFATPYGVEIPIHRLASGSEPAGIAPNEGLFSAEDTALLAGIYLPSERARFVAEIKRLGGRVPPFEDFGGHRCPKVALPRPARPIYPSMPCKELTPVEAWITGLMDQVRWTDRAVFLNRIIGKSMERASAAGGTTLGDLYPLSLSSFLTAALEHLGEREIDCIEAAAFYAVSSHAEWIRAGTTWLEPFRETWFRDWRDARPRYARFATSLATAFELPDWLGQDGDTL